MIQRETLPIPRRGWLIGLLAAIGTLIGAFVLLQAIYGRTGVRADNGGLRARLAGAATAIGLLSPGVQAAGPLPPVPPTQIGMNAPAVQYYSNSVPFQNLVIGSEWVTSKWQPLPEEYQDGAGDLLALPPDGVALRVLSAPATGPGGMDVLCTFSGSGSLIVGGANIRPGSAVSGGRSLKFKIANARDKPFSGWLVAKGVDPAKPMRGLDCRDAKVARSVRFRPEFLQTLRGYPVIRFMDWQNANANGAVSWSARHPAGGNRHDGDGVAIEDMLALAAALGTDPWFVMPWNASDDYIARFAAMVSETLPANRSVYVEVGNEVWNGGFPVSQQAAREGAAQTLGTSPREATMRRYADRTVAVMKIWEEAFARRRGLVRVLSTQHVVPDAARIALSYKDTARHVDALATAPYFGSLIGDTGHTADAMFERLRTELDATMVAALANRAVARQFGKRYIAYEAGQGLVLPAEVPLQKQIQSDVRMYALYKQFLRSWKANVGDLLCLLTSTAPIGSSGAWGLTEYEEQTAADSPKLRAVLEER